MVKTFNKLWHEFKPFRSTLYLVILLGVVTGGLKIFVPMLVTKLIDAWNARDFQLSWVIPIVLAVLWVTASVTRFYHVYYMKYTADRVSVNQRRKLMDKYLSLNLTFFQGFESGSGGLISRMLNDIVIILNGMYKMADVIREPFTALGMLAYLFYMDWKLTAFVLFALPLVTLVLRQIARSLRKYSKHNQEIMEGLTRTLKESLDGTKIVQSFVLEDEMHRKFGLQADKFLESRRNITSREEAAGPISESLTMIFLSLLLLYIGYLVFHTSFSTASFMGFVTSMGFLQDSIRKLQDSYIRIQQAGVAMDRLSSILDTQSDLICPEKPTPFPTNWQEIEFRNVSFAYKDELVLRNINLKIKRNQNIAFVGSSGSGKSTLVNLLQRFFDPTEGDILIGGISIKQFDLKDLRRHIALVTQDVFLFNDTIEKNINMGRLNATPDEVRNAAQLANAHGFIMNTPAGYETSVGDFGSRMSGGEKQRLSIARAILKNSPILVLDEATSALDSESELEVQKGLSKLLEGRTAFVIAHRLSTISKSDRIIVLKKGTIVEQGDHNQLIDQKGEYYKFHQMQFLTN